jgi:hypothetical protein
MLRFVFIISILSFFHPVHVSLLSLDYDKVKEVVTLFVKVYYDDLENDCRLLTKNPELQLYNSELMPSESVLQKYIAARIVIEAGDERLKSGPVIIESDGEEVRIYSSYHYRGSSSIFTIRNTIMTGLYSDQSNLMIFKAKDFEKGYRFTPELTDIIINTGELCY